MHFNPAVFDEPDKFKPERYINEHGELHIADEFREVWTFGKGRRSCVGQYLAERNIYTIIGYTLALFTLERETDPKTGRPVDFDMDGTEDALVMEVDKYKLRFVARQGVDVEKCVLLASQQQQRRRR